MRSSLSRILGIAALASVVLGASKPVALLAELEPLGKGTTGTVTGVVVRVAPEDRERVGDRVRVTTSLRSGDDIVDRHTAVVAVEADGTILLYRDWKVGTYHLRVGLASLEGSHTGIWIGEVEIPEADAPFVPPEGALPDAVALALTPPRTDSVNFLPPPDLGGIGAVQLQVEAPEDTASVEFFHDGESLGKRNRPPWTVSIALGEIVHRTRISAVARDASGAFLGEDALVLNSPTGELGIEILLAPENTIKNGRRAVTVAVSGSKSLQEVSLHLDDRQVARWAECPCVTEIAVADLERAAILSAEATDAGGIRGDAVTTLTGGSGFSGFIRVELVELPVVILNAQGAPVDGLGPEDFKVYEDDVEVTLEGFGTTADLPLSLALAVDTSGSMTETFPSVRRAVTGFASELMEEDDEAILLTFSWEAKVIVDWTDEPGVIGSKLDRLIPEGGTSLHDAVVRSLEQFRGRRGRQALVLLTDGEDTTSRTGWKIAKRFVHTMRVPIFPIGLSVGSFQFSGRKVLKGLALETGGAEFFPKTAAELPMVYARISELLRSQYLLWYSSNSEKPAVEFREIRVEVTNPDYTVKTIRGYYPGK